MSELKLYAVNNPHIVLGYNKEREELYKRGTDYFIEMTRLPQDSNQG